MKPPYTIPDHIDVPCFKCGKEFPDGAMVIIRFKLPLWVEFKKAPKHNPIALCPNCAAGFFESEVEGMNEQAEGYIYDELQRLRAAILYLANCIEGFGERDAKQLLEILGGEVSE